MTVIPSAEDYKKTTTKKSLPPLSRSHSLFALAHHHLSVLPLFFLFLRKKDIGPGFLFGREACAPADTKTRWQTEAAERAKRRACLPGLRAGTFHRNRRCQVSTEQISISLCMDCDYLKFKIVILSFDELSVNISCVS